MIKFICSQLLCILLLKLLLLGIKSVTMTADVLNNPQKHAAFKKEFNRIKNMKLSEDTVDSDCYGHLKCFHRNGWTLVPGCGTAGADGPGLYSE